MGFGEQGNQISSKSHSFQCKIYECAQFSSTSSRVKCLFFRRAKELNRRCQCDVNLTNSYSGSLSLFFPHTRRCTFRQTESLAGCLNNDDSDGTGTGTVKYQSNIGLDEQNTSFAGALHSLFFLFFLHFLTSLYDYDVKILYLAFYRGRDQNKTIFF